MSASSEHERLPQRQLGELMTELGLISEEQLATVLEVQQQSKRPLGQIIVELGFASGAAVAHALAMQSGGALKTEYGFALGVPPKDEEASGATSAGLPKLRLAATAVAPPARPGPEPADETETEDSNAPEAAVEQAVSTTLPDEPAEPRPVEEAEPVEEPEPVEETDPQPVVETEPLEPADETEVVEEAHEIEDEAAVEPPEIAPEPEEAPDSEPEDELHETEAITDPELSAEPETDPVELAELRAEIERLSAALADAQAGAAAERERLQAEAASAADTFALVQVEREQEIAQLREHGVETAVELERLQASLDETQTERSEELTRLQEERDRATAELERMQASLDETQTERREELTRLQEERDQATAELERLQASLAVAESAAAEHERQLADERERHFTERSELASDRDRLDKALADIEEQHAAEHEELAAQRERLQEELGSALERLAAVGPAVEERDELRAKVEQLETTLAELRESSAAELRGATQERDNLTTELDEARELLAQAERVRESQIALEAERDRAVAELERLQTVSTDAQAEVEELTRLLASEQDLRLAERKTLLAQRTLLEEELGSAIERLAAAAAAADEREKQLKLGSQRLVDALDAVRALAAELVSDHEELPQALVTDSAEAPAEAADETEWAESATETEAVEVDYSLFVPGPNGYELIPQTGVPPHAGQTVELDFPDREEPAVFEVVRSGRTLPDGDVCVYLAQV